MPPCQHPPQSFVISSCLSWGVSLLASFLERRYSNGMPTHSPLWAHNQGVCLYHCFKPEQSAGGRLVIRIPVHIHADCSFQVAVPSWKHVISLVWKNISFCFLWLCKNKCQRNSPWEKLSEVIFMESLLSLPYQQPHRGSVFSIPLKSFRYSANIFYAPTTFQTLWEQNDTILPLKRTVSLYMKTT